MQTLEFLELESCSQDPVSVLGLRVSVLRPLSLGLEAPYLAQQYEQLYCLENSKTKVTLNAKGLCGKYLTLNEPLINADQQTALHVNL